ncbi:MAG: hypothetical protein GY862_07780 [Gammaproteobacteria bacterium]|nr:hypothetical protein [Gammaproteobacteria bacterium]
MSFLRRINLKTDKNLPSIAHLFSAGFRPESVPWRGGSRAEARTPDGFRAESAATQTDFQGITA